MKQSPLESPSPDESPNPLRSKPDPPRSTGQQSRAPADPQSRVHPDQALSRQPARLMTPRLPIAAAPIVRSQQP
eukprot:6247162-Karenia_brevis.AAC.1